MEPDDPGNPPQREEGSVTHWIRDLKQGDRAAAQALWDRYFRRLVLIAREKRRRSLLNSPVQDEEDAALSAFHILCAGLEKGRFPRLHDREDLWRLLVVVTARRVSSQNIQERARKRGGGWQAREAHADSEGDEFSPLDSIDDHQPTPEFAALMAEETDRLLAMLESDELRQIALWKLEGFSNEEIAEKLFCALRTVARRLDLIRTIWNDELR